MKRGECSEKPLRDDGGKPLLSGWYSRALGSPEPGLPTAWIPLNLFHTGEPAGVGWWQLEGTEEMGLLLPVLSRWADSLPSSWN